MGSPDTIKILCHNCQKQFISETKLSRNEMIILGIGSRFEFVDCILLLKEECQNCGKRNAIEIKKKTIIEVRPPKDATLEELPFREVKYLH